MNGFADGSRLGFWVPRSILGFDVPCVCFWSMTDSSLSAMHFVVMVKQAKFVTYVLPSFDAQHFE